MNAILSLRETDRGAATGMPEYRELPATGELGATVACYWQIAGCTGDGRALQHRVLPDACVDIIFDLAAWRSRCTAPPGRVVGTMTRAACVTFTGDIDLLGIRCRPGGALRLGAECLRELTDTGTSADDWFGPSAAALTDELASLATFELRAQALDRFLCALPVGRPRDRTVVRATQLLSPESRAGDARGGSGEESEGHEGCEEREEGAGPRVRDVARALGLGERQFERRFADATGLTPAAFRRVLRFRRLLCIRPRAASWADAAVAAGYFDQAHMIREFERLAGLAPQAWSREQRQVGFVQDSRVTVR